MRLSTGVALARPRIPPAVLVAASTVVACAFVWKLVPRVLAEPPARQVLAVLVIGAAVFSPIVSERALVGVCTVAAVFPVAFSSGGTLQPLLLGASAVWIVFRRASLDQRARPVPRLLGCAAVVLAVGVLLACGSLGGLSSAEVWVMWLVWLAVLVTSPEIDELMLMRCLVGSALLAVAASEAARLTGVSLFGRSLSTVTIENGAYTADRFTGTLGDYELYGEMLALAFVIAVGLVLTAPRGLERIGWAVSLAPIGYHIVLTGTRSDILLAVAGGVLVILVVAPVRGVLKLLPVLALAAVIGRHPLATALQSTHLHDRLDLVKQGGGLARILDRHEVWGPFMADERPFSRWVGTGPVYPFREIGTYPHSLWLVTGYTIGLIGLVGLVLLILVSGAAAARRVVGSKLARVELVVLVVWVLNESKVEFVRIDSYGAWLMAILALPFVARAVTARPAQDVAAPVPARLPVSTSA
jgi:hypothetical protein